MDVREENTAFRRAGLDTPDIVVVVVFIIFCLLVGIWATWRTQRGSVSGYFLAGRDILWFAVGASLFSSNIGSGSFVGLAGTGAASGIAVASYELNGLFCLLLLGWIFVPVYIASGVYTMPEYLMKRFGGQRLQLYMAFLSLVIYVFTKISADIYAGSIFILQAVKMDMYLAICILLVVTAIYTVSGGLRAVIYTDTLQTVIMVLGSVILMIISFDKVGGISALYEKYPKAIASHHDTNVSINFGNSSANSSGQNECGVPPSSAFHLFRDAVEGDIPWPGNVFGITILSSWYFCNDQVLVQRSLAAKNMHHVKGGSILAAYLKILPLFTTIFPGMISRVLFTDEVGCNDPDICEQVCSNRAGCTNIAYPKLVIELMPPGLKGLMLAAMIAALMSSLTSNFNSAATIFTIDVWKRLRAKASDGELLVIGRIFILAMVGLSVAWIPILQASQGGQLFNYIQSVTGYFAPPILALFILAILWKRTNEMGAFWGLMVGLVVGVIRMGLDFSYDSPACGEEDSRPLIVSKVHFLHFTVILFVICFVATIVISLVTKPIDEKHLLRVTWWTRHSREERIEFPEEYVRRMAAKRKKMKKQEERRDGAGSMEENPLQSSDIEIEEVAAQPVSKCRKIVYLICGYEPPRQGELSEEEEKCQKEMLTSIKEDPFWKKVVNGNAVILMLFGVFLWAFFA